MCRWHGGFTTAMDSFQSCTILMENCPERVLDYIKEQLPELNAPLKALQERYFPTMTMQDVTSP